MFLDFIEQSISLINGAKIPFGTMSKSYHSNHVAYWKKKSIDNSESYNLQESFAVTKDDIYNEAKKHVGSTKWKLVGNTYKCNIFVDDVFANVGAKRPQR